MEVSSTSEDELRVVFRIDDSEFRRQLGELRREVEETGREGIGPARTEPSAPEPPVKVDVTVGDVGAVDGGVSEERMKELSDKIDRIESGAGLTSHESMLTVADVERRLNESLNRYPVAQKLGLEEGERGEYTTMFKDLFSMLEMLGNRQGKETWMTGWGSTSDISGLRLINRLITEVFPKDIIKKGQFGHIGTAETIVKRAIEAVGKGPIGPGGERVFHGAIQLGIQALSDLVKGGEVVTGTEVMLPGGGRLDVGMLTDDLIYMAEVKTGVADIGAIRQVRGYMEKYIEQQFIQKTKWEPKEEGDVPHPTKEVVPWLRTFLTKRQEEGKPKKWLTSIVVAPGFTGGFGTQMEQVLQLSTTVDVVKEMGALRTETVDIPEAAQMYMMRGLEALPPAERTKEANSLLWIEWLAGTNQYDTLIKALNIMNVPQEELNEYMATARGRFREKMIAMEERLGRPLTEKEVTTGVEETFIRKPKELFQAEQYNIRSGIRSLGLPGWERRRGRTAGIKTTLGWGVEAIVGSILSEEEALRELGGAIIGGRTDDEEEADEIEEVEGVETVEEELSRLTLIVDDVSKVGTSEWLGAVKQLDTLKKTEQAKREVWRILYGGTKAEETENLRKKKKREKAKEERVERMKVVGRGVLSTLLPVPEERESPTMAEYRQQRRGREGEPLGGILPVDIDMRQYQIKLDQKARRMGLTPDEFRDLSQDMESGKLMKGITGSFQLAVNAMKSALTVGGEQEELGKDLKKGLSHIFKGRADEVIEEIMKDGDIDAKMWTADLKKIMEGTKSGESMISKAVEQMGGAFNEVGRGIQDMEDFRKYSRRLEPATGVFTWVNCA